MGATASTHRGESFEIPFLADIGEMRQESGKDRVKNQDGVGGNFSMFKSELYRTCFQDLERLNRS